MKHNVGTTDRAVRAIVGVAIIGAGVYFQSWWGAVGAVLLVTALAGWCPPYALLGINTCKAKA
ncbi:hypothetical protein Tel_10140 [Candidatus Tenderia electrophaga]|uniref:Inner membrane protein YgaP-like transmembrane domain-containing protein n=1 Tax=Candidatus Tenderia electrophaga TaxID=1748243 RepID=A0A0S2TI33_9GAMM|nr:hypothetical protein Tel_10140 [Candidatus Tenderia electrophaga]